MGIEERDRVAVFALTRGGALLGKRIQKFLTGSQLYLPERLQDEFFMDTIFFFRLELLC